MNTWRRKAALVGLSLPASVAIWGGWVSLGRMCGFGEVELLPGVSNFKLDLSITLPIGMEMYAAYALGVSMDDELTDEVRKYARYSSLGALLVGMFGQAAYHTMQAWGWEHAPPAMVIFVACLPVAVLGLAAHLAHLSGKGRASQPEADSDLTALVEATAEAPALPAASPASQPEAKILYLPPALPASEAASDADKADEADAGWYGHVTVGSEERKKLVRTLVEDGWDVAQAAARAGVDKSTGYRWTKDLRQKQEARS